MAIEIASGYRNKDTQELKITTNHAPVINECLEGISAMPSILNEDFRVVIPMFEIVSARLFHPEVYERFQPGETRQEKQESAEKGASKNY